MADLITAASPRSARGPGPRALRPRGHGAGGRRRWPETIPRLNLGHLRQGRLPFIQPRPSEEGVPALLHREETPLGNDRQDRPATAIFLDASCSWHGPKNRELVHSSTTSALRSPLRENDRRLWVGACSYLTCRAESADRKAVSPRGRSALRDLASFRSRGYSPTGGRPDRVRERDGLASHMEMQQPIHCHRWRWCGRRIALAYSRRAGLIACFSSPDRIGSCGRPSAGGHPDHAADWPLLLRLG